jgi:peptide deformylase
MATLQIKIYPDPILKQVAVEENSFDAKLHKLLDDMKDTMYAEDGIGLAAPQIGVSRRIAVIDVSPDRNEPLELVNPEILTQEGKTSSEEGCLSIPDFRESITRFTNITVSAQDRHGKTFEIAADGILAICMQHEIDHLDGVLFVDHLSRLKRELFRRWHKKHLQESK